MKNFDKGWQKEIYEELYSNREVDLSRQDTPTLTLKHLGSKGLLRAGDSFLDIGCGVGKDARIVVSQHGFSNGTGIDTSKQAIEDA